MPVATRGFRPPPSYIAGPIAAAAPGLWPAFLGGASAAVAGTNVRLTSWWRDRATNSRVGGAPQSQHLVGLAFDFNGTPSEREIVKSRARRAGFIVVDKPSHVHVQAFPAGALAPTGVFNLVR